MVFGQREARTGLADIGTSGLRQQEQRPAFACPDVHRASAIRRADPGFGKQAQVAQPAFAGLLEGMLPDVSCGEGHLAKYGAWTGPVDSCYDDVPDDLSFVLHDVGLVRGVRVRHVIGQQSLRPSNQKAEDGNNRQAESHRAPLGPLFGEA